MHSIPYFLSLSFRKSGRQFFLFARGPAGAATEPLVTKLRNSRRFTPLPLFVGFFQQARWFLIFLTARRPNT